MIKIKTIEQSTSYGALIFEGTMEDGMYFRLRRWGDNTYVGFGPDIAITHMITPDCLQMKLGSLGELSSLFDEGTARAGIESAWLRLKPSTSG